MQHGVKTRPSGSLCSSWSPNRDLCSEQRVLRVPGEEERMLEVHGQVESERPSYAAAFPPKI